MKTLIAGLMVFFVAGFLWGGGIDIDPARCVIVDPSASLLHIPWPNDTVKDLAKHFKLIFGCDIEIVKPSEVPPDSFQFMFDTLDPADEKPFAPRETRWSVTKNTIYFYGRPEGEWVRLIETSNAVYFFLEEELGVHWIKPGDDGIVYKTLPRLRLTTGVRSHIHPLAKRGYRAGAPRPLPMQPLPALTGVFESLDNVLRPESADPLAPVREYNKYVADEAEWRLRRMRLQGDQTGLCQYGHAFTTWWDLYKNTHPEYFALNRWGYRGPDVNIGNTPPQDYDYSTREKMFIKLCVSNTGTVNQVIENWKKGGMPDSINACANDHGGFCRCKNCLALDGITAEIMTPRFVFDHVSDRYVYFANRVAEEAEKIKPGTLVSLYAYNQTLMPPKTQKLHKNLFVAVVTRQINREYLDEIIGGWRNAGAKRFMIRVNLPFYFCSLALPLGAAREMSDSIRYAYSLGAVGFDFDHLMLLWSSSGLIDYAINKTQLYPDQPFEKWENEYCSAYGEAADDVKKYFRYWENNWEKKIMPDYVAAVREAAAVTPYNIIWDKMGNYFSERDFDTTDAFLDAGAEKSLSSIESKRLNALILGNRDSRLLARSRALPEGPDRYQAVTHLLNFREKRVKELDMDLARTMGSEMTGGRRTISPDNYYQEVNAQLRFYPQPWVKTAWLWKFKVDDKDVGRSEKWENYSAAQIRELPLHLSTAGLRKHPSSTSEFNKKFLYKYDGAAWYFTAIKTPVQLEGRKEIIIYLHSVGDHAEVFINGGSAGKQNGGPSALTLNITKLIDWDDPEMTIAVRQEGMHGVARAPWITGK
ncbi:MAG: DUF4838 domain-containing protein [Kiritimatiellia bacterium]